jgi:NDP-hexose 2,3-enoyl reductase
VSEQSLYNLIERRAELEVIPSCREYGLGVITWSPLAGGLLAGASLEEGGRRHSDMVKKEADSRSEQLARFSDLCRELGESPSVVALAWLLCQTGVTAAIVGPGKREQLTSVLHAPELRLNDQDLARIEAIFPACGPAPEAYAW